MQRRMGDTHLEVVRAHEEVCNALALDPHNPLVEIFGLGLSSGIGHFGISDACQAFNLHKSKIN